MRNWLTLLGMMFIMQGCDSNRNAPISQQQPPAQSPPVQEAPRQDLNVDEPMQPQPPPSPTDVYTGPPVQVQIMQAKRLPPISTAIIEVTVPTGGWTFNLDEAKVEGDIAKIYLTLEKPGADELVTQALETHQQTFTSEHPPFTKAKIYIHQAQRDIQTLTTNYRLAATAE